MRENKLNFGIIIRIFLSLLPLLFGMPTLATIFCAYNIAMTFIAFGPLPTVVSSLTAVAAAMFLASSYYGVEGEVSGLVFGLQAVLCATGCIAGLFIRKDFYRGLTLATSGMLAPQLIYARTTAHANGMSLADMLVPSKDEIAEIISPFIEFPQYMNEASPFAPEHIAELVREFTVMLIPSALIISSMVLAYIVMWAVAAPLRRMPNHQKIHSFSHIRLPRICTILTLVLVAVLLYGFGGKNIMASTVMLNMIFVFSAMALFAGISLLDFYLRKSISIKFLRVIIHIIIAFNFFPIYILAAFLDSFANFRKLPKESDKKGGGNYETKK